MTEVNCENVRMASMAETDGASSSLSPDQLQNHLATCSECRQEVQEMAALTKLFDATIRVRRNEQIWPMIEQRLEAVPARPAGLDWRPFLVLGLLLAVYRIILMVTGQGLGPFFKLVPVALVIALFLFLKENPFKVNPHLSLKGVTS